MKTLETETLIETTGVNEVRALAKAGDENAITRMALWPKRRGWNRS